jgi:hypothetical protein
MSAAHEPSASHGEDVLMSQDDGLEGKSRRLMKLAAALCGFVALVQGYGALALFQNPNAFPEFVPPRYDVVSWIVLAILVQASLYFAWKCKPRYLKVYWSSFCSAVILDFVLTRSPPFDWAWVELTSATLSMGLLCAALIWLLVSRTEAGGQPN